MLVSSLMAWPHQLASDHASFQSAACGAYLPTYLRYLLRYLLQTPTT